MELEVNGIIIDLSEDTPLLVSYAVNELGKLETRQGSSSNDFSLLLTSKTRKALGFSNNPNSVSNLNPRARIPAKLLDSRQIIDVGYLQIAEIDYQENIATCSFFGSNSDWFALVKDIQLNTIDLSDLNHVWNRANITASFNNESGYIYPLIDYGKATEEDIVSGTAGTRVDWWYPALFAHTILSRAIQSIGYKLGGQFVNSPIYKKLILPYSNDGEPTSSSTIDKGFQDTELVQYISLLDTVNETRLQYTDATGQYIYYNPITFEYAPQESGKVDVNAVIIASPFISFAPFYADITVRMYKAGVELFFQTETINAFEQFYFKINQKDIVILEGETIYFTIQSAILVDTLFAGGNISIKWNPVYQEGQLLNLSDFLPNKLSVADLLLTLCYQYTLFFQVDTFTKTISVFQFENVERNKYKALDWSDKVDYNGINLLNFTEIVQNYGKKSYLTYAESSDDGQLTNYNEENAQNFGDGTLNIDNEFIESEVTILESKFSPTLNIFSFNNTTYIPYIPIFSVDADSNYIVSFKPNNRILLLGENTQVGNITSADDVGIVGNDGTSFVTSVPFAYFYKRTLGNDLDLINDSLAFSVPNIPLPNDISLIEKYYSGINRVLNEIEFLRVMILLKPTDINNLDFSIPIYLNIQTGIISISGYFFINLIQEFSGGNDLTEVHLIQLR